MDILFTEVEIIGTTDYDAQGVRRFKL